MRRSLPRTLRVRREGWTGCRIISAGSGSLSTPMRWPISLTLVR